MNNGIDTLSAEKIAQLKQHALFKNVSEDVISATVTRAEDIHLLKDELAFRKGERYHKGIYFLLDGKIILSAKNKTATVSCENDAVGLSTFLNKTMYTMDATAETDCDLLFIHELCIYKLMEISADFRQHLVEQIQLRLKALGNATNIFQLESTFKSVGNCMSSPVMSIYANQTISDAVKFMNEHHINSVLVVNRKQIVKGLITSKSLMNKLVADFGKSFETHDLEYYIDSAPITFPPEYPVVEALNEMESAGQTHALVMKNGKPAGVVTAGDLKKVIFENSAIYSVYTDNAASLDDLKNILSRMHLAANYLANSSRISREELTTISSIHHAIQKKVFQITANEFAQKENFTLSDFQYCFLILGSGARREMDLRPQINYAVILDDSTDEATYSKFQSLLSQFTENLVTIGYCTPICNMRSIGKDFVMRLSDWFKEVDQWASKSSKEIKSCFSCVMDMAAFEGNVTLSWSIRNYMLKKIADKPSVMAHLITLSPPVKVPVSQFGGFILEKSGPNEGMFNLQSQGLHYLINSTRLLSVYAGISDMGTVDRIKHLARKGIITGEMAEQTITAFDTIVETLINEQINQAFSGSQVTNYINPSSLSLFYQEKLKRALHFLTIYTSYATNLLRNL